ncbi:hypothetical protein M0802_011858 [Mischocyttarus mexicanus]|nr:hypothetical protein M0802_011858 [Mischocyttarus mexicanus]
MIVIILVLLFGTITTINTNSSSCENNSNCQCLLTSLDDLKLDYDDNMGIKIMVDLLLLDSLEVICNGTQKLEDFNYSSELSGKSITSLSIRSCILSDLTSLEKFVKKLGIVELKIFSFQSFETNNTLLTKEHLNGITNVKELILSHNSLFNISSKFLGDFPELEKLDLSHNNIKVLIDTFNASPNLKYLDLNKNFIYAISAGLFNKLENLEYLDFGYNRFQNIHESAFNKLVSLKSLSLKANGISDLSCDIFSKLKKLESIDISFNSFASIPQKLFIENKNLRRILFNNNTVNLLTLPGHLFLNLENLEEIYLNNVGFKYLPDSLFTGLSSLKYISLENNNLSNLKQYMFQSLENLEVLKINNNLIEIIPNEIFIDLVNLKILDLSMNNIDSIPSNDFLRELHLSNNSIQNFFVDWSTSFNLTFLNLSHNDINTISTNSFYYTSHNILIDLRHNKLSNILLDGIETSSLYYHNEKRYVMVLVDHNPILCDCHLYNFIRYFHNEMPKFVYYYIEIVAQNLTCIHNDGAMGLTIKELNSSTYICPEDEYFKIENKCQINCTCSVRPKDKTRILDCSNMNMSNFLIDEKRVHYVENYSLILNITGNALTRMPSMEYLHSINLTHLLLSNNRISEITFEKLPTTLKVLEMHNNEVSRIDTFVLVLMNASYLNELTLSGNPFICDCDTEALFLFIKLYRSNFKDLEKLTCENMNIPLYKLRFNSFCKSVSGLQQEEGLHKE